MSRLTIAPPALLALTVHASASADGLETGGIVLGDDPGMGGVVQAKHCGDPGPEALREPNRFSRDVRHAQVLADQALATDGSRWIGEWHTHLRDEPVPSTADLTTYKNLLEDPDTVIARLIALIVTTGPGGNWTSPILFAWSFTGTVLRQLQVDIQLRDAAT